MTNSEYDEMLLDLIDDIIIKPLASLNYNRPLEDIISEFDGYIDGYILASKKIVEYYLRTSYNKGAIDATDKLNTATEQKSVYYTPIIPDKPEQLEQLIKMQQRNVEDYALVLRGRIRSSIETYFYLDFKKKDE